MDLTAFRKAIQAQLENDLEIVFVPGMLEGPVESRDLGSCYLQRISEAAGRIQEEDIVIVVRVFKQFTQILEPEVPYDPEPLEQLLGQLQASVQANQTGLGAWFQRVVAADIDPIRQGIEATIMARALNDSV